MAELTHLQWSISREQRYEAAYRGAMLALKVPPRRPTARRQHPVRRKLLQRCAAIARLVVRSYGDC